MFCFSKFCRICLSKNNTLVNVDHLTSDNVSYLNKLQFISPTLVEKQCNYMLLWICDKCVALLNSAYKFQQHCLTTESLLERYYLQLSSINTEQRVCNNLIEESIENPIKKEECLEDLSEIQDEQYFLDTSITIEKHDLSPVDLKTDIKFNDSTFESIENVYEVQIYLEEVDFSFNTNDETNKNGSDFIECSPNLSTNIPEHQVAGSDYQNNITSCTEDDSNDVLEHSNEHSVNSSKLLATNRSIKNERRQNFTNLNRNKSAVNKNKTYECNICKKKFSKASILKMHKRSHTGERPYKCKMCPKKFSQAGNLKTHERFHSGELPYKCNMCPMKFNYPSTLKIHERLHSEKLPYKCNMCLKKFNYSNHLKRHEKTHTGERPFKCKTCPKKFIDSNQLKVHERLHTGELPYKCNLCPKKFNCSSHLKRHVRIHNEERSYKCNVCPKKFNESYTLKLHERLHTGDRPYKCNICSKKFTTSGYLKVHQRLHNGELPYKCSMCPKKCNYLNNMKRHERTHTEKRPYKCKML